MEKFVSSSLSRKRFQEILDQFHESDKTLGNPRNTIKIVDSDQGKLVVKSFRIPNVINKFVYRFLRPSKAKRSYENALYLLDKGLGTPAPLAYLETYKGWRLDKSYYVSDYADHDFTYREIINDESLQDKEHILREFTQFMYRLHEANVLFLDNSPGNTLIKKQENGYSFYLVDLNRMKFYDIPLEDRLKNFSRLAPVKWIYEIMGDEYARLTGLEPNKVIESMWGYTQQFQEKFARKKRWKKKWLNR